MGGEPWFYIVPYQPDITKAMTDLRQREFDAGRYYPAQFSPGLTMLHQGPSPGAKHKSIDAAIEAAGATGTQSILDMNRVAADPDDIDYGVVTPLADEVLEECFGTTRPTREMAENDLPMEDIERGQGIYVIIYNGGKPSEICFAGYSYD